MRPDIIMGTALENGSFHKTNRPPRFIFLDAESQTAMSIDQEIEFMHTLLIGGSGSGKSNVLFQMVAQITNAPPAEKQDCITLIFDTKGDYFRHRGFFWEGDLLIGNNAEFRDRSQAWNLFDEVLADGEKPVDYEANAREIAAVLFKGRGSKTQPFFTNAARDIFANTVIYFIRRSRDNPDVWRDKLNNCDLVNFLMRAGPKDFLKIFQRYPDMQGLTSYFGDGSSNQALGVFGELRSMLYDCFQGVFRLKPTPQRPAFSIRQAMRSKGGRSIFIEYDLATGEVMTPMYRLLVDLALKEALSRQSNGRTYLFLDELKLLPEVTHLEDALNFGRGKRVCVVAGLQNVNQMYAIYGRERGQTILGGFGSVFAMRTSDADTREYITQLFGSNVTAYTYRSRDDRPIDREHSGHTVEDWHQRKLRVGQAIVGLASQPDPFLFQFERDPFE